MSVCKLLYTATLTKSVITSATFFSFRSLSNGHIRHFSLSFSNVITVITPSLYQSAWEGLSVFIRQNFSIARSICNTVSCLSTETSNQILPLHWSLFPVSIWVWREKCVIGESTSPRVHQFRLQNVPSTRELPVNKSHISILQLKEIFPCVELLNILYGAWSNWMSAIP